MICTKYPEWLGKKLQKSWYQRVAEKYYRTHHNTNSLYFEVTRQAEVLVYDGWDYKRGLNENGQAVQPAQFAARQVEKERWKIELACTVCFAKRAKRDYDWNVIPVFEGHEIEVKENNKLSIDRLFPS